MVVSINRREFLLGWTRQSRSDSVEVEVMEVFAASEGPFAFLIHHANESSRNAFAAWLRAHDRARITCRLPDGTATDGRIFRVKMCFGRGLVVVSAPIRVRARDKLSIN